MSGDQRAPVDSFSTDDEEDEVKISAELMATMTVSRPHTQVNIRIVKFSMLIIPDQRLTTSTILCPTLQR